MIDQLSNGVASAQEALGNCFSVRISCKFLISDCRGDSDLGLRSSAICICSRSRLRRRICWLAKMQAGAMTGAMMGMSTGTLAGNWALDAHGDDSMPCYYCM